MIDLIPEVLLELFFAYIDEDVSQSNVPLTPIPINVCKILTTKTLGGKGVPGNARARLPAREQKTGQFGKIRYPLPELL